MWQYRPCDGMTHYPRTFSASNLHYGGRTWRFSTANTRARHWTRSWGSSIRLQYSQPISQRFILIFSYLIGLPAGTSPPNLTAVGANLCLGGEKPATNRLYHGTAVHTTDKFNKLRSSDANLSLVSLYPGGYLASMWVCLGVSFSSPKNSMWRKAR
jgi:hypothetical protein